jgi:hypothetical protein
VAGLPRNGGRFAPDWVAGLVRKTHLHKHPNDNPKKSGNFGHRFSLISSNFCRYSLSFIKLLDKPRRFEFLHQTHVDETFRISGGGFFVTRG